MPTIVILHWCATTNAVRVDTAVRQSRISTTDRLRNANLGSIFPYTQDDYTDRVIAGVI